MTVLGIKKLLGKQYIISVLDVNCAIALEKEKTRPNVTFACKKHQKCFNMRSKVWLVFPLYLCAAAKISHNH